MPKRFLRPALRAGLLLLAGALNAAAAAPIEIVAPLPHGIVNVGAMVAARVDAAIDPTQVKSVDFEYSRDLSAWLPITAPAPDGMAEFAVLWNAGALPAGTYYLRARLTDLALTEVLSDVVEVRLNAQPEAQATTTRTSLPFTLRHDARSSSDPDGLIVDYDWDFGDGTRGKGPLLDHRFPGPGTYGIALTVTDDQGGTSTRHTMLALAAQGVFKEKEKNTCGCKSMTVKSAGAVEGPDALSFSGTPYRFAKEDQRALGVFNHPATGDQLDMTMADFDVGFRFEVIAELQPLSKPQLCEEGQRVQRIATANGVQRKKNGALSSDPRYDSSRSDTDPFAGRKNGSGDCGPGDAGWCDDDYHGGVTARGARNDDKQPPGFKRYEDERRILWLDAPGKVRLSRKEIQDHGYTRRALFEATVSGPNGAAPCSCSWETSISVDKTGKVTNRFLNLNCKP